MNDFYFGVGTRIKELREKNKYTGEELAEMIDRCPKYLNNVELGKQGFSGETLYKLSKALHVKSDYILTGAGDEESNTIQEIVEVVKQYDEKKQRKILQLLNWYMYIDYVGDGECFQSVNSKVLKCQNDTFECTLEEMVVLRLIDEDNEIKQNELVIRTGKSLSTIKRVMESLQNKNYIRRINGKRYAKWEVLVDIEGS